MRELRHGPGTLPARSRTAATGVEASSAVREAEPDAPAQKLMVRLQPPPTTTPCANGPLPPHPERCVGRRTLHARRPTQVDQMNRLFDSYWRTKREFRRRRILLDQGIHRSQHDAASSPAKFTRTCTASSSNCTGTTTPRTTPYSLIAHPGEAWSALLHLIGSTSWAGIASTSDITLA